MVLVRSSSSAEKIAIQPLKMIFSLAEIWILSIAKDLFSLEYRTNSQSLYKYLQVFETPFDATPSHAERFTRLLLSFRQLAQIIYNQAENIYAWILQRFSESETKKRLFHFYNSFGSARNIIKAKGLFSPHFYVSGDLNRQRSNNNEWLFGWKLLF